MAGDFIAETGKFIAYLLIGIVAGLWIERLTSPSLEEIYCKAYGGVWIENQCLAIPVIHSDTTGI